MTAGDPVRRLGASTWPEVAATRPVLLVPLGSTEQHGPHLPLDTDTRIARCVSERAAAMLGAGVIVAAAVAYGASGEHDGFAGTLSIGTAALTSVLVEIARSADHFAGIVWVNAHGGNSEALRDAVALLDREARPTMSFQCAVAGGDAHAGRTETSMLLAIAPEVVRLDAAVAGEIRSWSGLADIVRQRGVAAVSMNGVLGDPTGASASEGRALLSQIADRLVADVTRWRTEGGTP